MEIEEKENISSLHINLTREPKIKKKNAISDFSSY